MNVSVRPSTQEDADLFARLLNNPDKNKWLIPLYQSQPYTATFHHLAINKSDNRLFTIFVDGKSVGFGGLSPYDKINKTGRLWGALADESYAKSGVITKAANLALKLLFEEDALHSVYARAVEGNTGSIRILEKNGFRLVGRLRQAHKVDESYRDILLYDLLRSEFKEL